jgi:hypothetical protein
MATTTDEPTTVQMRTELGSSGPIPVEDFNAAADAAAARLRGEQLSFELGVGRKDAPDFATVKIAGSLTIERDLRYMEHVTVTVVDRFGEVVAEAPATVGYPGFKDHFDKTGGKTVERLHVATLD